MNGLEVLFVSEACPSNRKNSLAGAVRNVFLQRHNVDSRPPSFGPHCLATGSPCGLTRTKGRLYVGAEKMAEFFFPPKAKYIFETRAPAASRERASRRSGPPITLQHTRGEVAFDPNSYQI